jgi:[ribosomal protein S5]-alanine N-acetyltransferase
VSLPPRETVTLETARLILRPRTLDDAEALHAAFADVELMRYWSGPPHASVEETRADLARDAPEWRRWAITLKGDDTAIGVVAAGEKRQGNVSGIAREAVTAVIDRIFAEGQRRVFADTDPDNVPSRAMLERLGFKLEAVLRAEWETHLGVRDTTIYGLLREEWSIRR